MEKKSVVAAAITAARIEKGLTQQRLADMLGVNRSTLALWESGRIVPSAANVRKLASVLDLPSDLLGSITRHRGPVRYTRSEAESLLSRLDFIVQQGGGAGLELLLRDTASVMALCKGIAALDKLQVGTPQYLDQLQAAFNAAVTVFKGATSIKGGDAE